MDQHLFIDGEFRSGGGERLLQINPATEETFAEVAAASADDVDRAVVSADRAFKQSWRDTAPDRRSEILLRIAARIREQAEALAQAEMRNVGKPITAAREEVGFCARIFEYYAGAIGTFAGETLPVPGAALNYTLRQPLGVVAAIVPWNYPLTIASWKVAPALATGNCVVLKPSELSPITALMLGQIAVEAGLPAGVLQVLPGTGAVAGEALTLHPLVRKISFTGSTAVGSRIMELASRDIKRVSLELGGKSPNIVFADADLAKAATAAPMSVFANSGQDCCARSRCFVERRVLEEFLDAFVGATRGIVVGDPAKERTQLGPLVSAKQKSRVTAFFDGLDRSRHTILCGPGSNQSRGYYVAPTIIVGCEPSDAIWRDEVFGPVVCVRPFDDESAMLEEVNASAYGLSGSIWTRDIGRALRVARRVESGVLSVNSHSSVHVEAPFGGFKRSGLGRDLGTAAMAGYTELKNVFIAE
jgi:betaine-aldehyde dehydrogenase